MNVTVSLAPLDSTDMGWARANRNDHRIWQFCRQFDLISDAEQIRWFNRQSDDPTIRMYKVMAKSDGAEGKVTEGPVGVCGLTSIDHVNRRAEFSLWIAAAMQGRGLGRQALQVLLDHGFSNLGLNLIWGESFAGNPALRMFDALGFKREGVRRQFYFRDGAFIDANLFSITAGEFYERRLRALGDAERGAAPDGGVAPQPENHPERPGAAGERVDTGSPDVATGEKKARRSQRRGALAKGAEGAR